MRWAARTLIDASLQVFVGQHRVQLLEQEDDDESIEERASSFSKPRETSSIATRPPSMDPMTAPHFDSLFSVKKRRTLQPDDLTLVMPYHFRRHASIAARRSWNSHDVARG